MSKMKKNIPIFPRCCGRILWQLIGFGELITPVFIYFIGVQQQGMGDDPLSVGEYISPIYKNIVFFQYIHFFFFFSSLLNHLEYFASLQSRSLLANDLLARWPIPRQEEL